jgi:quercetin dioxygenase-like cupin family protein
MTQVSVVAPDGGEAIQLGPIQMRILEDGKTTGHRLGVGEITIPPGTAGPPQHRHAQHDEAAGTLVMVPPGAPHTFANPGEEPVVLLNTFTPDLYVRYFRDLGQMIADGQPLTPESTEQAMSRYATETLS